MKQKQGVALGKMKDWTGINERSIPFGSQLLRLLLLLFIFFNFKERMNEGGRSLCRAWSRAKKRELNGENLGPIYSQSWNCHTFNYRAGWWTVDLICPSFL
ncbi:hypothetical protein ACB092_09G153000 [Castanea dentata]